MTGPKNRYYRFANQVEEKFEMRFQYFVESVRDPQQGSRRHFAEVTSWGKIMPVRCRLLELPLGVKNTSATTSCFTLIGCLIFIPTSRFQNFLLKEQIQYPHLNAAKVS